MKKRKIQKQRTRVRILDSGKKLFLEQGFLNVPISKIADEAEVAKGTVFAHFENKQRLTWTIINQELDEIYKLLIPAFSKPENLIDMLEKYLNLIILKENLFVTLKKELPYYPPELRRKIIYKEILIIKNFYEIIKKSIEEKKIKKINPQILLHMIFGTIEYYLNNKSLYCQDGSVIQKFKEEFLLTIENLVKIKNFETNKEN